MLGASFLPARFRSDHGHVAPSNPGYLRRQVTTMLQSVARRAFTHPIHTIVFVALLASTSYVGVLEGSLLDPSPFSGSSTSVADLTSLFDGGRQLRVGEKTGWQWQLEKGGKEDAEKVNSLRLYRPVQSLTGPATDTASRSCHTHFPKLLVQRVSQDGAPD